MLLALWVYLHAMNLIASIFGARTLLVLGLIALVLQVLIGGLGAVAEAMTFPKG